MPVLTTTQKNAVAQFVSFTATDKKVAERLLKSHNWNVQNAVNGFFAGQGGAPVSSTVTTALNKLFDKYRDSPKDSPDLITIQGTMAYMADLDVALDHVSILVVSQLLQSPSMGEITRDGFLAGWAPYSATSTTQQKTTIAQLTAQLSQPEARGSRDALFARVYRHTFTMSLAPPKRSLDLADAVVYWRLLFSAPSVEWADNEGGAPWLEWWVEFTEGVWGKAVNRDVWEQTRVFAEKSLEDKALGFWSEESSWPSVIDEFVGWVREKKGVGSGGKREEENVDDGDAMDVE